MLHPRGRGGAVPARGRPRGPPLRPGGPRTATSPPPGAALVLASFQGEPRGGPMTDTAVANGRQAQSRPAGPAEALRNYVGGRWVDSHADSFFDVHNPATGEVIARTPLSTARDVDAAVAAAKKAFPGVAGHPGRDPRSLALPVPPAPRRAFRGARAHRDDRARQDARRVARQRAPRHRVRRGRLRRAVADDGLRPREHRDRNRLPTSSASRSASARRSRRSTSRRWCRSGSCPSRSRPATPSS